MFFIKKKLETFERVEIRQSGMRSIDEYEIVNEGENTRLSLYTPIYKDGEKTRKLKKTTVMKTEEMVELMNKYGFAGWDGFDGPHPRGVLDGIMFRLSAVIDSGKKISAEGSQNFPRGYRDFMRDISERLYNAPSPEETEA